MKKLLYLLLFTILSVTAYGQADYNRTPPTGSNPATTATYNKVSQRDANVHAVLTFFLPKVSTWTLNNAKDSAGAVVWNTALGALGVYEGSSLWDTVVVRINGTSNNIAVSTPGKAPTIAISGTYPGQTSITTLGTIVTGVWHGTTLATGYGGTGLSAIGSALQTLRVNAGGTALEFATAGGGSLSTLTDVNITSVANNQLLKYDSGTSKWINFSSGALTIGTHLSGTSYTPLGNTTIATDATDANTASTIVARDASNNFAAGIVSATAISITGTAGNGFVALIPQSSAPSTPSSGVRLYSRSTGAFSWIGQNGFTRSIVASITADRVYTLPDFDGTFTTNDGVQTLTNKTVAAGSNTITGITNTNLSGSAGITNANLANSSVTLNGNSLSLGGSLTLSLASSSFANQGTTTTVLHGNASGNPSFAQIVNADITNATIDLTAKVTGILPNANTTAATAATAATIVLRDASANILNNSYLSGYTTTATAGGTTTLTVASTYAQNFTGTLNQTVVLPVASTLTLTQPYLIINNSTGLVTVNSSGGNQVAVLGPSGASTLITCILTSGTSEASWSVNRYGMGNSFMVTSTSTAAGFIADNTSSGPAGHSISVVARGTEAAISFDNSNNAGLNFYSTSKANIRSFGYGGLTSVFGIGYTGNLTMGGTTLTSSGSVVWTAPAASGTVSTDAGAVALTNKTGFNGLVITANTGVVTTGTWNATSISTTYTDAKIKTVTGTTNRLTVAGTSTDPTFDVSTSYVGQATITTLGTIASGVWQGTKVGLAYGGTNADLSATGGAANYLKQVSSGAAISVGTIPYTDITGTPTLTGYVTTDQTSAQTIGATGARLTKLWATDITVTNAITGSVTGNAGTATALATARTIGTITGDATSAGSTFDGTANNTNAITVTKINGVSLAGLATGILKNTTTTGAPSIAVAGDFPTLNQNTTGSAATLTTTRAIYGNNFDGSAALTQIIASTFGGTGNGFTKFSGPATTEKTFTLPNASATILTDNALVTAAQGGTGVNNSTRTLTINTNAGTLDFTGASKTLTIPLDASVSGTNTGDNAANSSTMYIGTTAHALNRSSASEALTGITSIDGNAASSTLTLVSNDASTNATYYPTYVTSNSGNQGVTTASSKLTFNPSTGVFSSTSFTGAGTGLTGTASSLNIGGSAATLTTARAIYGNNFDGSAALAQIIASTYGGTGNGFTKFTGATTSEKTYTLPNASATILTDNAVVTAAQGGTGINNSTRTLTISTNAGTINFSGASKTLTVPLDASVSGTNTGDQTITLTGNVTGSGTGSFATTIAAGVVTNAMLAGGITNANLANSTISGIALGSTLANLTATDATLTFSGTYTGGTARTIGLNLGNANTFSAAQSVPDDAYSASGWNGNNQVPTKNAIRDKIETIVAPVELKDFYTDISTTNDTETDLQTYTIPANTLNTDGQKIIFTASDISTAAYGGTETYFYLAGTKIATFNISLLNSYNSYSLKFIRSSSSEIRYTIVGFVSNGSGGVNNTTSTEFSGTLTSIDFTSGIVVKNVGKEALAATGTITMRFGNITWYPAAP